MHVSDRIRCWVLLFRLSAKHAEERELQAEYDALEASVGAQRDRIQAMRDLIASQEVEKQTMAKNAIENEALRRKRHNKLTELKGNIRVFGRVRPIKDSERPEGQLVDTVGCPTETGPGEKEMIKLTKPGVNASNTGGEAKDSVEHSFGFDKVFPMQSTQEQVFGEVSTMVQSALDGYKVCIFAYGQTGSGKTHTMQGGEQPNTEGIIPRSIVHILNEARRLKVQGWEYTLTANFLEIYNENIRDLLHEGPQKSRNGGKKQAWGEDSVGASVKHTIMHDDMGNTTVSNMTTVQVASLEDVSDLMARAEKQRSVSATAMNSRSSRSHSVFTLRLSGRNESQGTALVRNNALARSFACTCCSSRHL
jgi:kinesin family protein C1